MCSMPPEYSELADLLPVTADRIFPVPLTVGVISDTHINPNKSRRIPLEVFDLFERFKVDLLIHAGDAKLGGRDQSVLASEGVGNGCWPRGRATGTS